MLDFSTKQGFRSRGDGLDWKGRLGAVGAHTVIENGVRIFHPENVGLGENSFIGHGAIIDGYYKGHVALGDGCWIGAFSFLHGAGGLDVGRAVGIGPRVTVLTSEHDLAKREIPVLHAAVLFKPVSIGDGADLGAGCVIVPGVSIGEGAVVGGGAVVTRDVPSYTIVAGNPARILRPR